MKTRDIFKFIKEKLAANKGKRISVRDVAKVGVAKMADFPYKERTLVDYIERFNAGGSINLVWGDKEVARAGIIEFIDEFNWVIDFDEYECIDPVDNNETVNEPYNQSESNEESKGSISSASLSGDVVLDDSINRGHDSTSVVNYIGDIIEDEYGRARQDRAEDKSTSLGVDNTLGDSRDVNDNNSVNDDEHRGEVNSDVHNNCNRFTGIRNN
ncbi:MAG: hypothetical protein KAH32_01740, partial [Chlamydiia bacterium]|nr:hypothetical protein [Chlamydiia bacterium]